MARLLDRLNQRSAPSGGATPPASEPATQAEAAGSRSSKSTPSHRDAARREAAENSATSRGDRADRPAETLGTMTVSEDSTTGGTVAHTDATQSPRRVRSPENWNDISAMRELANLSARDAIDAYSAKRLIFLACGKLMVAIVAAMAAALLFTMTSSPGQLIYVSTGLACFIAAWWGIQSVLLWRRSLEKAKARRGSKGE
jgi:hypothetical protein